MSVACLCNSPRAWELSLLRATGVRLHKGSIEPPGGMSDDHEGPTELVSEEDQDNEIPEETAGEGIKQPPTQDEVVDLGAGQAAGRVACTGFLMLRFKHCRT
eukprot:s564_g8.t1